MDFPLSSSVILVVTVALWIVWVAPYVLRNRRQQFQTVGTVKEVQDEQSDEPESGAVLSLAKRQEKAMETMDSKASALPAAPGGNVSGNAAGAPVFRVRYGRCGLALAGLGLILAALVSGVFAAFGAGSGWVPVAALAGGLVAFLMLRRLAVRDRRTKAALRTSRVSPVKLPTSAGPDAKATAVFDAEAGAGSRSRDSGRLSAVELRQAALAVALAAGDESAKPGVDAKGAAWEPVDVPKPVYVDAPKVSRPAPEPLQLPEAPKPLGKPSLKEGAAGQPVASPASARGIGAGQSALSNLDDVLQRRRA